MLSVETSDGSWVLVAKGEWWFTKGTCIYPESLMCLWLKYHPDVGVVVFRRELI